METSSWRCQLWQAESYLLFSGACVQLFPIYLPFIIIHYRLIHEHNIPINPKPEAYVVFCVISVVYIMVCPFSFIGYMSDVRPIFADIDTVDYDNNTYAVRVTNHVIYYVTVRRRDCTVYGPREGKVNKIYLNTLRFLVKLVTKQLRGVTIGVLFRYMLNERIRNISHIQIFPHILAWLARKHTFSHGYTTPGRTRIMHDL